MSTGRQEVNAVATKLDAIDPEWFRSNRIDLSILLASSYKTCVIGQSFIGRRGSMTSDGPVWKALDKTAFNRGDNVALDLGLTQDDLSVLSRNTSDWRAAIVERRLNSGDGYIENRIAVLTRNGAIGELRAEARKIRDNVVNAFTQGERHTNGVQYDWCNTQLARAQAFDAEAQRLDAERPAGAGGLAS